MLEFAMYKRYMSKREKEEKEKHDRENKEQENSASFGVKTGGEPETSEVVTPVLTTDDELFLATLVDDAEHRPALPPRIRTPQLSFDASDNERPALPMAETIPDKGKATALPFAERPSAEDDAKAKRNRLAFLFRQDNNKPESSTALMLRIPNAKMQLQKILSNRLHSPKSQTTSPQSPQPQPEYEEPEDAQIKTEEGLRKKEEELKKKEAELAEVLEDLNLGTKGNRAFSLSAESAEMARKFNQVLRDLIDGVPTAYHDLTRLLDDKDGSLNKAYDKLPSPMKKLVEQLPEKITGALGPEVLMVAAEAGGIKVAMDHSAAKSGAKGAAKKAVKSGMMSMLTPGNLQKLVTKPGAVASMLRAIVGTLKTRWPAFISANILFSVSMFLLLFVLWYCHKRGREERLKREARGEDPDRAGEVEFEIEEVDDEGGPSQRSDLPMLASPRSEGSRATGRESRSRSMERRRRRRRGTESDEESGGRREGERERKRERERDWERDRDRDRDRDSERSKRRGKTSDRDCERDRERDREKDRDRERDGARDRTGDRDREKEERDRDRDRDRDRERARRKDRARDDDRDDRDRDQDRDDDDGQRRRRRRRENESG